MSRLDQERRTAQLVQLVYDAISTTALDRDDAWHLCRLTLIDSTTGETSIKQDALQHLLRHPEATDKELAEELADLTDTTRARVMKLLTEETGLTALPTTFHEDCHDWFYDYHRKIKRLLKRAATLNSDEAGESLCMDVQALPPCYVGTRDKTLEPSGFMSPLMACLDPSSRYPILRKASVEFLASIGIGSQNPRSQHSNLLRIMNSLKHKDAFVLNTAIDEETRKLTTACKTLLNKSAADKGTKSKTDSDTDILITGSKVAAKKLHAAMIIRLKALLGSACEEGTNKQPWDAIVRSDGFKSADTLIEIKTEPTIGYARMAVGQLFDYRRSIENNKGLQMAVLFPKKPPANVQEYLEAINIQALWFTGKDLANVADRHGVLWK